MAAAPITTLVAEADVTKTVVDAAVVADVSAPIAAIEAVAVVKETPVARGPERALVGSLNPSAGHPVETFRSPGPIAWCPNEVIAGSRWLVVIGQGWRRLGCVDCRLLPVARII